MVIYQILVAIYHILVKPLKTYILKMSLLELALKRVQLMKKRFPAQSDEFKDVKLNYNELNSVFYS